MGGQGDADRPGSNDHKHIPTISEYIVRGKEDIDLNEKNNHPLN